MKSKDFEICTPFLGVGDPLDCAAKNRDLMYCHAQMGRAAAQCLLKGPSYTNE